MLFLLSTTVFSVFSQSLLKPENDSTFTAEYRNGDEWAMIAKEYYPSWRRYYWIYVRKETKRCNNGGSDTCKRSRFDYKWNIKK